MVNGSSEAILRLRVLENGRAIALAMIRTIVRTEMGIKSVRISSFAINRSCFFMGVSIQKKVFC